MKKIGLFILIVFLGINVYGASEATLKNIRVNGKDCSCSGYECTIEASKKTATVTYELNDSEAKVDRLSGFSVDLDGLTTVVKIVVTNDKGEEKIENTYNITITLHEKSSDITLKTLKVNNEPITLLNDVFVYSYMAKYSDDKIVIDATTNDSNAKVKKEDEYKFDLDKSSMSIDFTVQAEDETTKTYRVVLKRGERPDTSLKSLKLDHGTIEFDKDKLEYEFTVDYSVNDLIIEAIANNDNASVKIEKEDLIVGENIIKIIVTNDKATSEYVLKVTREENKDKSIANIKSIKIKEYPKFDFEENVLDYTIKLRDIPEKLTIDAESKSSDGKVEIINNEKLEDGSKITIKNTLIETGIIREYTITILKDTEEVTSKTSIIIGIILVLLMIILMIILEIREKKNKRHLELTKILNLKRKKDKEKKEKEKTKKVEEDDLEII